MYQVIAEVAREIIATVEEINVTETIINDIEEVVTQVNEIESSVNEIPADGIEQLEANAIDLIDGQDFVADESGLAESVESAEKTEKAQDVVSDVELYTDPERRLKQALGSDGEWLGEPGKSEFIPNDSAARQAMKERGVDSIKYDEHCEPDFSPVSEGTVEIDNMTDRRRGEGGNYEQAFEKLAEQWNNIAKDGKKDWSAREVESWADENKLSPHERMDGKTMDFVPRSIHFECKHYGGCAEYTARTKIRGGFDV